MVQSEWSQWPRCGHPGCDRHRVPVHCDARSHGGAGPCHGASPPPSALPGTWQGLRPLRAMSLLGLCPSWQGCGSSFLPSPHPRSDRDAGRTGAAGTVLLLAGSWLLLAPHAVLCLQQNPSKKGFTAAGEKPPWGSCPLLRLCPEPAPRMSDSWAFSIPAPAVQGSSPGEICL